jgi:hypothetical protein
VLANVGHAYAAGCYFRAIHAIRGQVGQGHATVRYFSAADGIVRHFAVAYTVCGNVGGIHRIGRYGSGHVGAGGGIGYGERDMLRSALEIAGRRSDSQNASIAYFEQESASHDSALAEVTTERDTLRLEVQKLKDLNFEAQDRYAALEAERDEARRASETVHSHYVLALKQRDEAVANTRAECDKGYEALFQAHQRMVAERDELKRERAERMSALEAAMRTIAAQNAQVRAMNEQLDAVTRLIVQRMENSTHE